MESTQKECNLLKLVTEHEALIYRVLDIDSTALKVIEFCRIAKGKMLLDYSVKKPSYIYLSEVGTLYKQLTIDEYNRIIAILTKAIESIEC